MWTVFIEEIYVAPAKFKTGSSLSGLSRFIEPIKKRTGTLLKCSIAIPISNHFNFSIFAYNVD